MNFTGFRKLIIASLLIAPTVAMAQKNDSEPLNNIHNRQHKDLLADQRNIRKEINLIDSLTFARKLQQEAEAYPAIELYGDDWNNEWVNPYNKTMAQMPDSFSINVSNYCMPVPGHKTSDYGYRARYRRMHKGVDLALHVGDTVRAAFSGKVRITKYEARGYGYYVLLRHSNGLETIYGHLSKILVRPNQIVKVGEPIALGGNTGRSTGPHLHFETRFLGMSINPNEIFDFVNQVPHTDTYVFHTHKENSSVKQAMAKGNNGTKYVTYKIRKGDTLSSIAIRHRTTITQLCRINHISKSTKIKPGQILKIK
ncbi:peptidoglycan DD-metalloendopeptidase family protein [Coprobacter tertius]|uniref:M23 family metallopeptidase n=1 Tax=Coprobacter tertius TaxID=2944915 RepID=A0ABT1MLJ1_9BACT|nr:peptidoglycan DD-metalloendopeptidase family protein [Coprobacter tertius]MCP9612939.1 M23 family metallopeptidase [Coprobacter tertius]